MWQQLLSAKLTSFEALVRGLDDSEEDSEYVLEQYRDQVVEVKDELSKLTLLKSEVTPDDPLMQEQTRAEKAIFDCLLIKKRLRSTTASPSTASEATVAKLPKLELPTFHGVEELLGTALYLSAQPS